LPQDVEVLDRHLGGAVEVESAGCVVDAEALGSYFGGCVVLICVRVDRLEMHWDFCIRRCM
jgi:hypothetical protein